MSSRSPGCSPTSITRAWRRPSPITACVAPSHSSQARHSCTASRRLVATAARGSARGAIAERELSSDLDSGLTRAMKHGTHRLLGLDVRRMARAPVSRAEPKRRWLELYAERVRHRRGQLHLLPAGPPRGRAGWVEQTPPGFLFAVKASRYLTHIRRLTEIEEGIRRFYEPLEPLIDAGRLGPVLWQLPENFHRDDERLDAWLEAAAAGRIRSSSAIRAGSRRRCCGASRARGVALAIGDHPERPFQSHEATAAWRFVRFHYGSRGRGGNYSATELEHLGAADRPVAAARGGVRVFQQRLERLRAGQRARSAAVGWAQSARVSDRRGPKRSLDLVGVDVLAVALIGPRMREHHDPVGVERQQRVLDRRASGRSRRCSRWPGPPLPPSRSTVSRRTCSASAIALVGVGHPELAAGCSWSAGATTITSASWGSTSAPTASRNCPAEIGSLASTNSFMPSRYPTRLVVTRRRRRKPYDDAGA